MFFYPSQKQNFNVEVEVALILSSKSALNLYWSKILLFGYLSSGNAQNFAKSKSFVHRNYKLDRTCILSHLIYSLTLDILVQTVFQILKQKPQNLLSMGNRSKDSTYKLYWPSYDKKHTVNHVTKNT